MKKTPIWGYSDSLRGITFAAIILIYFFDMKILFYNGMTVHGKHINTLLRTRIQDGKSAGTLAESALKGAITRCKSVVYPPPARGNRMYVM